MYDDIKNDLNALLQEAKIIEIFRVLNLICFTFALKDKRKLFLHAECVVRIFDSDNRLVMCTKNLYRRSRSYRKKKFDYQKIGTTLFDDSLQDYQERLYETSVLNAAFRGKDLKIRFLNGMHMDVMAITTIYDDPAYCEDYRIFGEDKKETAYIV